VRWPKAAVAALLAVPLLSSPAQAAPPSVLNHVGSATRVLIVTSRHWTSTTASATQWQKRGTGWVAVRSNMYARIGRNGFKTDRREGDGTTPAGKFPIRYAFGGQAPPGTTLRYQRIVPRSCWSGERADYNRWVRRICTARDEDLYRMRTSVYRYAAVVGFNDGPAVWGKGSAIFMHQTIGKATSGCVALTGRDIVATVRWLAPGSLIVMGPESYVATL
jgi:L,D-peptidoglycan transpeptidase YkuD (ErfK/YbiS/YcfS/YnhG family)